MLASGKTRVIYQHQLKKRRKPGKKRPVPRKPELTVPQILAWADSYRTLNGHWPKVLSGRVARDADETWTAINHALTSGLRGLPGKSSLAKLLAEKRGVRNVQDLPAFSIKQILKWADLHHKQTREWPTDCSGPIHHSPLETWRAVDMALRKGLRGMSGESSLAQLLAAERGVTNIQALPHLDVNLILSWADAFHERTGDWPTGQSGSVLEAPAENWHAVDAKLGRGGRGLPGGSSLAQLLDAERGVRNRLALPRLTNGQILEWARLHHLETGQWPTKTLGPIIADPMEAWSAVDTALRNGLRGLPGNSSLAQLLAAEEGVRNIQALPPLSVKIILRWADSDFKQTGCWPTKKSGTILSAPTENWHAVDVALNRGVRGLVEGSSLAKLLDKHRGVRNRKNLPPFDVTTILRWADEHFERTGEWPKITSGEVLSCRSETWGAVNAALQKGNRSLPGSSTLARFLGTHRQVVNTKSRSGTKGS